MTGNGLVFALDQIGLLAEHQAGIIEQQSIEIRKRDELIAELQELLQRKTEES